MSFHIMIVIIKVIATDLLLYFLWSIFFLGVLVLLINLLKLTFTAFLNLMQKS